MTKLSFLKDLLLKMASQKHCKQSSPWIERLREFKKRISENKLRMVLPRSFDAIIIRGRSLSTDDGHCYLMTVTVIC